MKNPMASSNASSVLVYDAMPGLATTHLLGEFNASAEELTFDCTKGTTSVYVVGKDAAGKNRFKRLDMSLGSVRQKVLHAQNNDEIDHIFDTDGFFM